MRHASVDRAKRVDPGCRNHGSCPYCRRSRTMAQRRTAVAYGLRMREWMASLRGEGSNGGMV